MDNTTDEQAVIWRWHRQDERHKSHLIKAGDKYRWDDGTFPYVLACGGETIVWAKEPNNDMSAPCRRCLRAAAGLRVGRG